MTDPLPTDWIPFVELHPDETITDVSDLERLLRAKHVEFRHPDIPGGETSFHVMRKDFERAAEHFGNYHESDKYILKYMETRKMRPFNGSQPPSSTP